MPNAATLNNCGMRVVARTWRNLSIYCGDSSVLPLLQMQGSTSSADADAGLHQPTDVAWQPAGQIVVPMHLAQRSKGVQDLVRQTSRSRCTALEGAGLLGAGEQDPIFESGQLPDSCRVACFRGATSVFKRFSDIGHRFVSHSC